MKEMDKEAENYMKPKEEEIKQDNIEKIIEKPNKEDEDDSDDDSDSDSADSADEDEVKEKKIGGKTRWDGLTKAERKKAIKEEN